MALNIKQRLSLAHRKLALSLLKGAKTAEEVAKDLEIQVTKSSEILKDMLSLELVEKEGYPTKYKLKKEIVDELKRRKEIEEKDSYKLRLSVVIEVQAIEKELLKNQLKKVEEILKTEKDFTLYNVKKAGISKSGEHYSSFLEVNLSIKNFQALVHLMFFYGPTSLEVLKPERIEFSLDDFQDGLVDMSSLVNAYVSYISGILKKKELDEFYNQFFAAKK